ncbi:hypothetical protein GINT2_002186 [Glugoides intestinalis]
MVEESNAKTSFPFDFSKLLLRCLSFFQSLESWQMIAAKSLIATVIITAIVLFISRITSLKIIGAVSILTLGQFLMLFILDTDVLALTSTEFICYLILAIFIGLIMFRVQYILVKMHAKDRKHSLKSSTG